MMMVLVSQSLGESQKTGDVEVASIHSIQRTMSGLQNQKVGYLTALGCVTAMNPESKFSQLYFHLTTMSHR